MRKLADACKSPARHGCRSRNALREGRLPPRLKAWPIDIAPVLSQEQAVRCNIDELLESVPEPLGHWLARQPRSDSASDYDTEAIEVTDGTAHNIPPNGGPIACSSLDAPNLSLSASDSE